MEGTATPPHTCFQQSYHFFLEKWRRSLVLFVRKGRKSWILEGKIKIWFKANGFAGGQLGLGQAIPPSSPAADCKKSNISQPLRGFSLPDSSEHTFFNSHHALLREGIIYKWGNWGPEWLGNPGSKCGAEVQIQAPWLCALTTMPVPKWVGDYGVGIRNNPFGHCLCAHGWGPWGRCPCTGGQSSSVMNTVLEWYQHQQQKKPLKVPSSISLYSHMLILGHPLLNHSPKICKQIVRNLGSPVLKSSNILFSIVAFDLSLDFNHKGSRRRHAAGNR